MSDLVRTLVLCGILSGTQPATIMGLLLVMTGDRGRRNGWAYIAGAFVVEASVLLLASVVIGGTVSERSVPGRLFIIVRMLLGLVLVVAGIVLRRPARKPAPEIPAAMSRLEGLSPFKAFVAGLVLADYQGPMVGSLAIASAQVTLGGRLVALGIYSAIATGIPVAVMVATRSSSAHDRLTGATTWVMRNRRRLASWFALLIGLFLISDAALALL